MTENELILPPSAWNRALVWSTLLGPILWICLLSRGAFADGPAECWGPGTEPLDSQSGMT